MGTLRPGQVGLVNGKIGTIVVCRWKKKIITRSAPGKATKPPTVPQLDQRMRLGMVSTLLSQLSNVINIGYQSCNRNMTPVNAATKYHMNELIVGEYPDYTLDYTKVKFTLPNSVNRIADGLRVTMKIEEANQVKINWIKNDYPNYLTKLADEVYVVFHNVDGEKVMFCQQVATRGDLMVELTLPVRFKGKEVHGYMFLVSANGKLVSNTHYLGLIELV